MARESRDGEPALVIRESRATVSVSVAGTGRSDRDAPTTRDGSALWVPPGKSVKVQGMRLPLGAVYVGKGLHDSMPWGGEIEPALINPDLPIDRNASYTTSYGAGYWASYDRLDTRSRGAYLKWLSQGQNFDPEADITYPFLFFYGLERRVLTDSKESVTAKEETPAIRSIVKRLRKTYAGSNKSFDRYSSAFLKLLDGHAKMSTDRPPPAAALMGTDTQEATVRKVVGLRVREGLPIDVNWALAWVRNSAEIRLTTPAQRCPVEFNQLFAKRFSSTYPDGLSIKENKTRVTDQYQPASSGIPPVSEPVEIDGRPVPDVMILKRPARILQEITDGCLEDLGPYSRWVAKNADAIDTLPALSLLPAELLRERQVRSVEAFIDRVDALTSREGIGALKASELLRLLPTSNPTRFSKPEAVKLFQLIGALGYGVEPDVRFGGPRIEDGLRVMLFKLHPDAPSVPSPEYAEAATLLTLATEVSQADQASDAGELHLEQLIELRFALAEPERVRLRAHLRFLLANKASRTGLKKRLANLTRHDADAVGDLLIDVAAADGKVEPKEVDILLRLFKALGLDEQSLHSRLHAAATRTTEAKPSPAANAPSPSDFTLNQARLHERQESTRRVAAMLQDVFAEDDEPEDAREPRTEELTGPTIQGLDPAHSALFLALGEQDEWDCEDLAERAREFRLMPDGALDRLNEVAYERVDAPLLDGDEDGYELDRETWEEMRHGEAA